MSFSRPTAAAFCAALLLAYAARPLAGQSGGSRAGGEALSLGANALLGGATAGVAAGLRGEPLLEAFGAGAAGGALTYAGKRIAVERFGGAGLLGRQVAALGTSVSANAAAGRGALDRVVLPAGPVRLYLAPRGGGPLLRARLDVAAVAAAALAATAPGSRFDAGESLSSGALVFRRAGGAGELGFEGRHAAGVIQLRDGADTARVERVAAHERVHAIQYDQAFLLWAAPAEARLMEGARWSRAVHRWADLGLNAPLLAGLGAALPYHARPWEREADFLSRSPRDAEY